MKAGSSSKTSEDFQEKLRSITPNDRTDLHVVRFQVFTAVTMKNAVFWDIKTQFVPHTRHITSPLQSAAS
jgi:hypothetical protein